MRFQFALLSLEPASGGGCVDYVEVSVVSGSGNEGTHAILLPPKEQFIGQYSSKKGWEEGLQKYLCYLAVSV